MNRLLKSWLRKIRRWLREPRVLWREETSEVTVTVEIQQWLAFLFFALALAWYLASPSPVAMMSMVGLGGVLMASFLWARRQARHVHGSRRLRFTAMQVGDELEELISLRNDTPLPVIWAEYLDHSNIPGYTVSSARGTGPHSAMEWRAHTLCTRRGIFNLGPWEMRIGEPFGILQVRQVYLQRQEILVYPPLAELPEQLLPHHGALGDYLPLNQPLRAETIATYSVRGYVPGDPLRHIHWRTTARRFDPFVKVFAPEAASKVWLVPDFDSAVHVEAGEAPSLESMVTVIASLAAAFLQQRMSVGLFASAEKDTIILPRQGQPHLWSILQALAPLQAVSDHPLAQVLERAGALFSGNDLLILVTPSLSPDWLGVLRQISRGQGSRGRAEVVLLDPASFRSDFSRAAGDEGAATDAWQFRLVLEEQGITANILRAEDIRLISGFYGEISRWEFKVLGTGRAVARNAPRAAPVLSVLDDKGHAGPLKGPGT